MRVSDKRLSTEEVNAINQLHFRGWTVKESFFVVAAFVGVLGAVWFIFGKPANIFTAVRPREFLSIPAIFLSNFFHFGISHLIDNLIMFVPLGFFVFKLEGLRGFMGIFVGMLIAGLSIWIFGNSGSASAGFSGAVMACWGILFVSVIRRDYRLVVVFLVLSYLLMESTLFETIRPSAYAESGNISWLGHLGGIIGGMASQIRSLPIALELLYKTGMVTDEEFIAIANRIHNKPDDGAFAEDSDKVADYFEN